MNLRALIRRVGRLENAAPAAADISSKEVLECVG